MARKHGTQAHDGTHRFFSLKIEWFCVARIRLSLGGISHSFFAPSVGEFSEIRKRNIDLPPDQDTFFVHLVHHGIPRSTFNDWKNGKFHGEVVTPDVFDKEKADLEAEVLKLRRRLQIQGALLVVLIALVRVFGLKLSDKRLREGRH